MFITMIKDLEDTREKYKGYSYVRTMRNILVGKKDAAIAPYFKEKPYYGIYPNLKLEDLEQIMDAFVRANLIDVIHTNHGKLYCTHDYYNETSNKKHMASYHQESMITNKNTKLKYDPKELIKLTNQNIAEINRDSIFCYVLIGGNPYGVEGNIYIFTHTDGKITLYKGNCYKGMPYPHNLNACIPEAANFYSSPGGDKRNHPKGWKCLTYLMGHYVIVPREIGFSVQENLKKLSTEGYDAEERLIRGVCDAYIKHKENPTYLENESLQ